MVRANLDKSPTEKVVSQVNDMGLTEAAREFKVSKATLVRWLKEQGYLLKRIYVKEGEKAS